MATVSHQLGATKASKMYETKDLPGIMIEEYEFGTDGVTGSPCGESEKMRDKEMEKERGFPITMATDESSLSSQDGVVPACAQCPTHCSRPFAKPTPNGLYGQIADLKSQIRQLLKAHAIEKDAFTKQVNDLESQHSITIERNSHLTSVNRWLESKVKYFSHVIQTQEAKLIGHQEKTLSSKPSLNQQPSSAVLNRQPSRSSKIHEWTGSRINAVAESNHEIQHNCSYAKTASLPTYNTSLINSALGMSVMTPIQEADEDSYWSAEKEKLVRSNKRLTSQIHKLEEQKIRLNAELYEAREQLELLEFRVLELEEGACSSKDEKQFRDECVVTDISMCSPISSTTPSPLEIVIEIPTKISNGVRNSFTSEGKLNLVQSVALLGLYQKLIREYSNNYFSPISVMTEPPKILSGIESFQEETQLPNANTNNIDSNELTNQPIGVEAMSTARSDLNHNLGNGDKCATNDERGVHLAIGGTASIAAATDGNEVALRVDESVPPPLSNVNREFTVLGELDSLEKQARQFFGQKKSILRQDAATNTDSCAEDRFALCSELSSLENCQPWAEESSETDAGKRTSSPATEDDVAMRDDLEKMRNELKQKSQEMMNKETEYCLRLDALKCEKEECVHRLERKIEAIRERELKVRKEYETLVVDKAECDKALQQQALTYDLERDDLFKKLEESRGRVERLERRNGELAEELERESAVGGRETDEADALRSQLDEMRRTDLKQKKAIQQLERCLGALKAEIELDGGASDSPDVSLGAGEDSSADETLVRKVKELVEAEGRLQSRIGQLEKKEVAYRQTLDEADRIMADVERTYQERLEEMEQTERQLRSKIKRLEQNEMWLNQALKSSAARQPASLEVKKVGELLEHLMEAESAEARLKEKLYESQVREEEARKRLNEAEKARMNAEKELQDQDEMIRNVENMKATERTLNERIQRLETSESALRETLHNADAILAARERNLLETIEALRAELKTRQGSEELRQSERPAESAENENRTGSSFSIKEVEEMTSELQKLNGCEEGLELTREHLKEVFSCIEVCPNCHPKCGPTLGQLESRVQQLHEIVFGSCATSVSGHACRTLNSLDGYLTGVEYGEDDNDHYLRPSSASLTAMLGNCTDTKVERLLDDETEEFDRRTVETVGQTGTYRREAKDVLQLRRQLKELEMDSQEKKSEIASLALHVAHLQDENENLKRVLWNAEKSQSAAMDKASRKAEEMSHLRKRLVDSEAKVCSLIKQLRSLEQVQRDKDNLQELVDKMKNELKEKRELEHRLHAENLHLHHKAEALRERVNSLQLLKKDNKTLVMKQVALEKKLSATALSVTSLRQQIAALNGDCWRKEQTIEELRKELLCLQNNNDHHTYFRTMRTVKLQSISQSSDDSGILRDHSPTSMTSRESETSDDCILADLSSFASISEHSPSSLSNSNSADEGSTTCAEWSREMRTSDAKKGNSSRIPRYTALAKPLNNGLSNGGTATVVKISNLPLKCQSNPTSEHPTSSSKCLATPISNKLAVRKTRRCSVSSSDGSTCSDAPACLNGVAADSHEKQKMQKLPPSGKPKLASRSASQRQSVPRAATVAVPFTAQNPRLPTIPDAPSSFHVTRKVGYDGLLVAWDVPTMDSSGCSNGSTVSGYQIFVDGVLHQNVRSAHRTKALLNSLDLSTRSSLEISIRTLSLTGQESQLVSTKYSGEESLPTVPRKTTAKSAFEQLKQKFGGSFQEKARVSEYVAEHNAKKINSPMMGLVEV